MPQRVATDRQTAPATYPGSADCVFSGIARYDTGPYSYNSLDISSRHPTGRRWQRCARSGREPVPACIPARRGWYAGHVARYLEGECVQGFAEHALISALAPGPGVRGAGNAAGTAARGRRDEALEPGLRRECDPMGSLRSGSSRGSPFPPVAFHRPVDGA